MPKRGILNAYILAFSTPKLALNFYEMDPRSKTGGGGGGGDGTLVTSHFVSRGSYGTTCKNYKNYHLLVVIIAPGAKIASLAS